MEPLTRRSASNPAELAAVWGSAVPRDRAPRLLGLFAHPDDEVFCAGGTIARCAEAGAVTAIVSLTQGEAGQIRDAATATRRVLGTVRVKELEQSAAGPGRRPRRLPGPRRRPPRRATAGRAGGHGAHADRPVPARCRRHVRPGRRVRASRSRDVVPRDRRGRPRHGHAAAAPARRGSRRADRPWSRPWSSGSRRTHSVSPAPPPSGTPSGCSRTAARCSGSPPITSGSSGSRPVRSSSSRANRRPSSSASCRARPRSSSSTEDGRMEHRTTTGRRLLRRRGRAGVRSPAQRPRDRPATT